MNPRIDADVALRGDVREVALSLEHFELSPRSPAVIIANDVAIVGDA